MKKLFVILLLVLAACSLLSSCEELRTRPTPSASESTTPAPTPKPTPTITPEPTNEEEIDYNDIDAVHAYLQEYYSWEIEEANKYRVKAGDTEYYFETSMFLETYPCNEFPLYRVKDGELPEYLGTTGFAFQVFGDYIYIQSDAFQEDWPDGTLTRVVNLKDLTVTPVGRNINIFIPKQGSKVYYTSDWADNIYVADASLIHPKELPIEVPDRNKIEQKIGLSVDNVFVLIGITDVKDGWIYFDYDLCEPEGPDYYKGTYRIKTDGSKIEQIGEGQFGDDIEYED